jgi:hypothetical protein
MPKTRKGNDMKYPYQFVYFSTYRGRAVAENELEDMFATGTVCEGENPRIVARPAGKGPDGRPRTQWVIMINGG